MSTHTPGPWVIDWYDQYSEETGDQIPSTHAAAIRAEGANESVCGTCDGCHKIEAANARLIAAAPDLLAALKGILHTHVSSDCRCHCPACVLGRAAIAKAEGQS